MAIADIRQRPGIVLGAAILLHVVLISAQVNTASGLPVLQVVTFGGFSEVQRATMALIDGVRGLWSGYVALRQVQEENAALKNELQTLQVRFQQEHAEAQRTDNLRQLLELRERANLDTVAAEVIAGPASPDFRTVTIDKGSSDGLANDMAVISPAGVVGRVILPSRRASKVQLLIDRNAAAGALIERTRVQGVVMGVGESLLKMQYVPGTADVKTGDLVVTSGIDGIYPKGFVIGTIDHADRGIGAYSEITVRPAADFARLEEVLIVRTPPASREASEKTEVRNQK
jgi:rod shape-determining protein MreC